jgi:hypothetical protein
MRATSMRRLLGGAAALMLVGATLLSATGTALGAKPTDGTRKIYVGPNSDYKTSPGVMTFTPVSVGGQTVSTVYVKNTDNQTLTHVTITFANVQGGATISSVYGPSASYCPVGATSVVCDFGNILAGGTFQFTLVIDATAVQAASFSGTIVFNESTNPNGGNPQISQTTGSLAITASSCNTLTTFLLPGVGKNIEPDFGDCSGDPQRSALFVPGNANGQKVSIDDSVPVTAGTCGAYICFGNDVSATVNEGSTIAPYLTWLITYSAETLGNTNPKLVGFRHGTDQPLTQKKNTCGAPEDFTKDCIVGFTVNADGSVTYELRTTSNSVMKGLH